MNQYTEYQRTERNDQLREMLQPLDRIFNETFFEGDWFVTHPDYPGLMTDGKTLEEASIKFYRAKERWLKIAKKEGWKNVK